MEDLPCCHCGDFFPRSPKHKNQNYCMKPECRKAKKATWRREKMRTDEQFRLSQHLSHQKWLKATPGYWKRYRIEHPEKTKRNRELQMIRNRRRARRLKKAQGSDEGVIAKIDALKSNKFSPVGSYYLVPIIAKIDAIKVKIYEIPAPYP
jgi:hypothetical protein